MGKAYDIVVANAGPGAPISCAKLRVYDTDPDRLPVVLISEPADNPGMSVTNMAEKLRDQVVRSHPELNPEATVWLEHYPPRGRIPATFDRIAFVNGRAQWKHVPTEEVVAMLGEMPPFYE